MSGRGNMGSRQRRPRVCPECFRAIFETNPPYVMVALGNKIIGPFHSECAAAVARRTPPHDSQRAKVWEKPALPGIDRSDGRVIE